MKPIRALQGASNPIIQEALAACATRWTLRGARIAGVVEVRDAGALAVHDRDWLRDASTGLTYAIYQNLGPGSTACQLDAKGIVTACEAVRRQILAGCDLVILNKFGKLEAARSGLSAAFAAAVETDTPILTAVSPAFATAWAAFAGALAETGPPDAALLDAWWACVGPSRRAAHRAEDPPTSLRWNNP